MARSTHTTRATLDQASIVHGIMLESFAEYLGVLDPPSGSSSETLEAVEDVMRRGGAVIAWQDDVPVGTARFLWYPDHLYVSRVGVLPEYRGRGIASSLMRAVEDVAREMCVPAVHVAVRKSLPLNLSLYRGLGYQVVSIQPHPRGPDEVISLTKALGGAPDVGSPS